MGSEDKKDMDNFGTTLTIGALRAIAFVYDIITFPVYVLLQRPWKVRALSRRVKAELVTIERATPKDVRIEFDGLINSYKEKELLALSTNIKTQATSITNDVRSITYKSLATPSPLHIQMIRENIDTMAKIMDYCVKHHANKKCLGTREIKAEEDELQPNGRVFKKYVMGDYIWKTFAEVDTLSTHFGRGIRELGNKPKENLAIFAETRAEWMVAAQGLFKQNIPVVTIYATLGDEGIVHAVNETEVTTIITSYDLMPKLNSLLSRMGGVKTLIYFEDQLKKLNVSEYEGKVDVYTHNQVIKIGSTSSIGNTMPSPTDVAIIMYTSGSTGIPKGVILIHTNLIATLRAFNDAVVIYDDDCLIGFLPLAHVFELLVESVCLIMGISIGYSTPLTMLDTSSKIKKGTKGDASVLHPTCMTSVPLILDRISKGIQDKVSKGSFITKIVFKFAHDYKVMWMRRGYSTPLLDKIVFGKIRGMLGGRVRLVLCGGAPLSPDTHEQVEACLCLTVTQGYGLTETTACATIMDRFDRTVGRVGEPATACDIRLVNWEEGNYRITDKPYPRGEIVCGGDVISVGYYKLPQKTKEDFFESDGTRWFKTGDIGEIHSDGVLKIIDRKKDLVKLQAGEYVSLGKVETELKTCPIVDNICIYGDSSKTYCVALMVPNQQHLTDLAIKKGLGSRTFEDLCASPDMEDAVLKELGDHGKKCRLQKFEIPAAVKLCTEVWSPDMGLVTAAFKLKRKDIQDKYQHEINRMYEVNRMYAS